MRPNPQETTDLVTFTEEILNGKLHFLCSGATEMPIKTMNLNLDHHHQPTKEENFQLICKSYFIAEATEAQKYIVLSGYITGTNDIKEKILMEEEAESRLVFN